ncbi:MAG: AraC family ligand binding domain-containing protein, partial [Planctomycetota bacterium]
MAERCRVSHHHWTHQSLHPYLHVVGPHAQPERGRHTHDFEELVIVAGGGGTHFTAGQEHKIQAGDAFVIKPGMAHAYLNADGL